VATPDEQSAEALTAAEAAEALKAAEAAEALKAAEEKEKEEEEKKEENIREEIIKHASKPVYVLGFIPVRRLTTKERVEEILLAEAEKDYVRQGDIESLNKLRANIAAARQPAPEDPLDRVRVVATLIMVAALFSIVAVIVFRPSAPSGLNQIVSLASGLAGIGLGWLFGATRGKK
jgi:hypothetical protein